MKCPQCGKGSDVIESRVTTRYVRRRRLCLNNHRFSTREVDADLFTMMEKAINALRRQLTGLCR